MPNNAASRRRSRVASAAPASANEAGAPEVLTGRASGKRRSIRRTDRIELVGVVPMGKPVYPDGKPTLLLLGRWVYPSQKADDEGRGLVPDISAPAAPALPVAHIGALTRKIARQPELKDELEGILTRLKKSG